MCLFLQVCMVDDVGEVQGRLPTAANSRHQRIGSLSQSAARIPMFSSSWTTADRVLVEFGSSGRLVGLKLELDKTLLSLNLSTGRK